MKVTIDSLFERAAGIPNDEVRGIVGGILGILTPDTKVQELTLRGARGRVTGFTALGFGTAAQFNRQDVAEMEAGKVIVWGTKVDFGVVTVHGLNLSLEKSKPV